MSWAEPNDVVLHQRHGLCQVVSIQPRSPQGALYTLLGLEGQNRGALFTGEPAFHCRKIARPEVERIPMEKPAGVVDNGVRRKRR